MSDPVEIHQTVQLDPSVERKNESEQHWAIKSAIVDKLRSNGCEGEIETEKKTSDLIGDIRCELSKSPDSMPEDFVVEIETAKSNKDRLRATIEHIKFGYDVYWVFTTDAHKARRDTETLLESYQATPPSLGIASLADGELSLGTPITWDGFTLPTPRLGRHEFYIPTYDRYVSFYDFGDFVIDGDRVAIYRQPQGGEFFFAEYLDDGQQTLPRHVPWKAKSFLKQIRTGEIERRSPVRGSP